MSLTKYPIAEKGVLILACILAAAYTAIGSVGLWVFGGRLTSLKDLFFVAAPFFALPIVASCFYSKKWGAIAFSVYFLLIWVFKIVISLPILDLNPFDSYGSWVLLVSLLLTYLSLFLSNVGIREEGDVIKAP